MADTTEQQRPAPMRRHLDELEARLEDGYYAGLDDIDDASAALDEKLEAVGWWLTQLELRVEDAVLRAASELADAFRTEKKRAVAAVDRLGQKVRDATIKPE